MNKKPTKKLTKKEILENYPPPYAEGYWEGEFDYWQGYKPVNNTGKWWVTIQLEKIKNKLKSLK